MGQGAGRAWQVVPVGIYGCWEVGMGWAEQCVPGMGLGLESGRWLWLTGFPLGTLTGSGGSGGISILGA